MSRPTSRSRVLWMWVMVVVIYTWYSPLFHSAAQPDSDGFVCSVAHNYTVTGFGGATCTLKFPCSTRLSKFSTTSFIRNYLRMGCVLDVFTVAGTDLLGHLYPGALWVHVTLFNLGHWAKRVLNLVANSSREPPEFDFVNHPGLSLHEKNGTKEVAWKGVKVISNSTMTSALMSLPQFNIIITFNPTMLQRPAIIIQVPKNVKWRDYTYNSGPYAGYSLCATPIDGISFWNSVRRKTLAENKMEASIRFALTSHSDPSVHPPDDFDQGECRKMTVDMRHCDRRQRALSSCAPFLYRPSFVRCLHTALTTHNVIENDNVTMQANTTINNNNSLHDAEDRTSLSYRLFRSCMLIVCTGQTDFCRLLAWRPGNTTGTSGDGSATGTKQQGTRMSLWTWKCHRRFHNDLKKSLRRGCKDVIDLLFVDTSDG